MISYILTCSIMRVQQLCYYYDCVIQFYVLLYNLIAITIAQVLHSSVREKRERERDGKKSKCNQNIFVIFLFHMIMFIYLFNFAIRFE